MRTTRRICGVSFVILTQICSANSQTYGTNVLVWEDNFDGDSLNDTVWRLDVGNGCDQGAGLCGWGNFEKQTYTLDNHQVQDGVLTISAKREEEEIDERSYSSSRIRSMSPVSFLTGRIEARIRLPSGLGLWGAFWMLPANTSRGEWAATGEIDIMEAVNDMDAILGTIHYGGEYPSNRYAGCRQASGIDFSTDYHIYAVEWQQEEIRWYVDEQLYCTRTKWTSDLETSYEPYRAPFDTEFELLLNLAVGGALPGRLIDDDAFPAYMLVDYVRVYEIDLDNPQAEPFLGAPLCLPGLIEAESFDVGGLGLGFGDAAPEGDEASYRADAMGRVRSRSGRTFVANMTEGDWTAYSVGTDEAFYDITLEVSSTEAAAVQFLIGDDANCSISGTGYTLTEVLAIPETGTVGDDWALVSVYGVYAPAGSHSLKLCVLGGVGTNVDRITFDLNTNVSGTATSSSSTSDDECTDTGIGRPYMFGLPWAIPGYIEAEFYDFGGEGVGFHEIKETENWGDSAIRPADGVDIIEAESNPAHGQYIGDWQAGEWLAYTSHAEQGGVWDVVASVASGSEGSENTFRILANATNCSSADTDGFDGMGPAGVDLLGGPQTFGYTGSWEAFTQAGAVDVWVPAGTHRILFCADSDAFNMNYLRVYTPQPTPAPTPSPTPAPTKAPAVPVDSGDRFAWIYISLGCVVGAVCVARFCFIIYTKEDSKRRKRYSDRIDGDNGNGSPNNDGNNTFDLEKTPPTVANDSVPVAAIQGNGKSNGSANPSAFQSNSKVHPSLSSGVELEMLPENVGLLLSKPPADNVVSDRQPPRHARKRPHERSPPGHIQPKILPRLSSWSKTPQGESVSDRQHESGPTQPVVGPGSSTRGAQSGPIEAGSTRWRDSRNTAPSKIQPIVSPVNSVGGARLGLDNGTPSRRTPRQTAGLEHSMGNSLWDQATTSPLQTPGATLRAFRTAGVTDGSKRDVLEDALLRAVEKRWTASRSPTSGEMISVMPSSESSDTTRPPVSWRSSSFSDAPSTKKSAMLAAGKCWTCQCSFENSAGQNSCLGCGRVAPVGRPRTRGPIVRQSSWVPPGGVM